MLVFGRLLCVCYGAIRLLRPFPTRRSSDLDLFVDAHGRRLRVVAVLGDLAAEEDLLFLLAETERPEHAHAPLAHHAAREPGGLDRKSTRLNSSHVEISYAVFCLKKKNQ